MAERLDHVYCKYENQILTLHKIITGNGTPDQGLSVRIALNTAKLDAMMAMLVKMDLSLEKKKDNNAKVNIAIIGGIVAILVSIIPLVL